ncbi:response regulator transcription factor [Emcibacteraceae bacterium]|nr:response regulator transcription factor [Emcibacteraceae bacterium]
MRVLIIEDDHEISSHVAKGLVQHGHAAEIIDNGIDGLSDAVSNEYDAIVLDRMLPRLDGISVLKALRSEGVKTPVIFLSALGELDYRIEGLKAGADDYLSKPFAFSELLARIEAVLRRGGEGTSTSDVMKVADLELDIRSRQARRGDKVIDLKPREYKILEYLMRHKGRIVTRNMLLEQVWDYHFDPHTNVIDVHISRLRAKIDHDFETQLLQTVRGAGYKIGNVS